MAIEVKDKYYINITAGADISSVITGPHDLVLLVIDKKAGLSFPTFELTIKVKDIAPIAGYLSYGNQLSIEIGRTSADADLIWAFPYDVSYNVDGNFYKLNVKGICELPCVFFNKPFIRYWENKNSLQVLQDVLDDMSEFENMEGIDLQCVPPNDIQNWYCYNQTPYDFMKYVLKHSYFADDNFYLIGFDFVEVVLKDFKTASSQGPKYILRWDQEQGGNTLLYDSSSLSFVPGMGMQCTFGAFDRYGYDYDLNIDQQTKFETKKMSPAFVGKGFSEGGDFISDCLPNKKFTQIYHKNEMMHPHYNHGEHILRKGLSYHLQETIKLSVAGKAVKAKLYDVMRLMEHSNPPPRNGIPLSGDYLLTGMSYVYANGNFKTWLTLSREGHNNIQ